jgi:hypothetical protein
LPAKRWLFAIYGSVLVPGGPWVLIVLSSVLYYRWRRPRPESARWVNKHAWIAFLINASLVFALRHYWRR